MCSTFVNHIKDSELHPKNCKKPLTGSEQKGQLDPHFQKTTLAAGRAVKGTRVKARGLVKKLCSNLGREMMTAWTRVVAVETEKIDLQYGQEQNSQDLTTDW